MLSFSVSLRQAFDTILKSILGFGQSPYHGKPHTLSEIADDSIALIESLGKSLDRTIIVGASMAGIVCCEIAVRHQVAGVVSVGPICPGPETKEAFEHRVAVTKKGKVLPLQTQKFARVVVIFLFLFFFGLISPLLTCS